MKNSEEFGGKAEAYERIAEHTRSACDQLCKHPSTYRCCERQYCKMALAFAKKRGVTLPTTGHPEFPLMGPDNRCTAPAHLRPICAIHHCDINAAGPLRLTASASKEWTDTYFLLREQCGGTEDINDSYNSYLMSNEP